MSTDIRGRLVGRRGFAVVEGPVVTVIRIVSGVSRSCLHHRIDSSPRHPGSVDG